MISMTGFAQVEFSSMGGSYRLELKSLNHRFLDLKVRLPRDLQGFDFELRQWLEKNIKRGSVELMIEKRNEAQATNTDLGFEESRIQDVMSVLRQWEHRYQLSGGVRIEDVLKALDAAKREPQGASEGDRSTLKQSILKALEEAHQGFMQMKKSEGARLKHFFVEQVGVLKNLHASIAPRRFELKEKQKEKVKKKIESCFEAYSTVDAQMRALMETRIATEIAIQLERSDFEEEFVRFESHLTELGQYLESGMVSGKKLDFFYQELGREANTMGNKALDIQMSQDVIQIKTILEQMREQSLNLE